MSGSIANHEVESLLLQRDAVLDEFKHHLHCAQQKMKAHTDSKHRDIHWTIGELIYVKLRPYRQSSLARRVNEKLAPRFYGHFKILEKIRPVAYKLELPAMARIHPVFNISLLKKATGSQPVSPSIPFSLTVDMEQLVQPAIVLAVCPSPIRGTTDPEILIHWYDLLAYEDSWESSAAIWTQFPHFNLEDKVRA